MKTGYEKRKGNCPEHNAKRDVYVHGSERMDKTIVLCFKCNGFGVIEKNDTNIHDKSKCQQCNGTGRLFEIKRVTIMYEPFDQALKALSNIRTKLNEKKTETGAP